MEERVFRTLDMQVRIHGHYIQPFTEVQPHPEDYPVWEELIRLKVAEEVTETDDIEEDLEEGEDLGEKIEQLKEVEARLAEKARQDLDAAKTEEEPAEPEAKKPRRKRKKKKEA